MATEPTPTDAELAAMRAEFGITSNGRGIKEFTQVRDFARAILARWGVLRADKIVIPTDTMEQEFQKHYRRGYEAGLRAQPAPAASQKPLEYARLHAISLNYSDSEDECTGFRDGWRSAEKHHGIKET